MKTQNLIKTAIALIITLTLYSTNAAAQDKITFTWHYPNPYSNSRPIIYTTPNKTFSVNWGDGSPIETFMGGDFIKIDHDYGIAGEYTVNIFANDGECRFKKFICRYLCVTKLSLAGCSALESLQAFYNAYPTVGLTDLDLSGCSNLKELDCYSNKLTRLDLSDCTLLERFNCDANSFQLSQLFEISLLLGDIDYKVFGNQHLPQQSVVIDTELFAEQSVFDGIYTEYLVKKDGVLAPKSDYLVVDGKITFKTIGSYEIMMTNEAIISFSYPACVAILINVGNVGIIENNLFNISIYPNPTSDELKIESGELKIDDIEIYDVSGRIQKIERKDGKVIDISNLPAGIYFVKIITEQGDIIKKIVKQ